MADINSHYISGLNLTEDEQFLYYDVKRILKNYFKKLNTISNEPERERIYKKIGEGIDILMALETKGRMKKKRRK